MQVPADIIGMPITVIPDPDIKALGAAALAAGGAGALTPADLHPLEPETVEYVPTMG